MISTPPPRRSTRIVILVAMISALLCSRSAAVLSAPIDVHQYGQLTLQQYGHTSWLLRDGFVNGAIRAMTQSSDGYLWLGTDAGVFRFDGVRAVSWTPAPGQRLPNTIVNALVAGRDGTLWIGTFEGLVSWNNGQLTRYAGLANVQITSIVEARDGTIWVGTSSASANVVAKLCAFRDGHQDCVGEDGQFGDIVWSLAEDRAGSLWVTARTGVWRVTAGLLSRYTSERATTRFRAAEAADTAGVTVAYAGRVRDIAPGGRASHSVRQLRAGSEITSLFRDRDGGLWVGTDAHGVARAYGDEVSVFTNVNGLSGDQVNAIFQDREGTIWVATSDGLDRFRTPPILSIVTSDGSGRNSNVMSVLASSDGSLWMGTADGLRRWRDGQTTIYRRRTAPALPDDAIESLSEDEDGRIWITGVSGLATFKDGEFVAVPTPRLGYVFAVTGDTRGGAWVSSWDQGVLHVVRGNVVERVSWLELGGGLGSGLVSDAVGGVWVATTEGKLAYFRDGRLRQILTSRDGLGEAHLLNLQRDPDGAIWAATEGGFSRMANGHIQTMTTANGLPCNEAHWIIADDAASYWLYLRCALVRIARSDIEAWVADPKRRLKMTTFDSADGVRLFAFNRLQRPQVAKAKDGKIFFIVPGLLSIVDPAHFNSNPVPPPVHVEEFTADGDRFDASPGLRLRPNVRDLAINYTALSLVAPEKMHFRFKLDGQDADWREVVNDRQVQYSNLRPGFYRFRVTASNNSGVWNDQGDTIAFSIAPAYYQTSSFQGLVAVGTAALLWVAYRLRIRQLARQFNRTLEARVSERTRIARELHDTLLQSLQGLLLRFQSASNLLPTRPVEAKERLDLALDQAEAAITKGRNAVKGLRQSAVMVNDLAAGIAAIGHELTSDPSAVNPPAIDVQVEGFSRDLNPVVREEAYRIASEALRNAFKHAHARRITVTIHYAVRQLRVLVLDDGKGIDDEMMRRQHTAGHFGLAGMRERAEIVGGRLEVRSQQDFGTQVELRVTGATAYSASPHTSWWSRFLRRMTT
jgi:signal transduction histidine kinase/ligand-binding sensor domain-containing protein